MKKNIEIEEAFKIFESSVKDIGIEKISISKGLGYILAEDIFSKSTSLFKKCYGRSNFKL